jgi:hypothetical protein
MADLTAGIQKPDLVGAAPNYQTCSAADFFTAQPNACYILHYKNGASAQTTGPNKVTDQVSVAPVGTTQSAGWADASDGLGSGIPATTERTRIINQSNRFRDGQGRINLVHPGTVTTLTVQIIGPLPAFG